MSLFIPFITEILDFDCAKCHGNCCKYGMLPLTINESKRILKEAPLLKYFTNSYDDKLRGFSRYSTCWFFDEDGLCSIEKRSGYNKKPLFCRTYPFKIMKCGDEYFIHLATICPTMVVSIEPHEKYKRSIVRNAKEIIKLGVVREVDISSERFELEKKISRSLIKYLERSCYLDFAIDQKHLSGKARSLSYENKFRDKVHGWLEFLKVNDINLHNKRVSYELTAITSILRILLWRININSISYILAALYLLMLVFKQSNKNSNNQTPIYSYVSLLDLATGLAQIDDDPRTINRLAKFLKASGVCHIRSKNMSLHELADKHLPSIEQRMIFIRQLGNNCLNVDDWLLL